MIDTLTPYRPGLTAIAAVLALSSTPVIAQAVLPDAAAPTTTMSPPVAVPEAVTAPAQTVQSLPPAAPTLPDIAVTDASAAPITARPAPRSHMVNAKTTPKLESRAASPSQNVTSNAADPVAAQATITPAPVPQASNVLLRAVTPAPVTPSTQPTVRAQSRADANALDGMGYAGWVMLGGGLLIVAGGAAFALGRRPKRHVDSVSYATPLMGVVTGVGDRMAEPHPVVVAAPVAAHVPQVKAHRSTAGAQSQGPIPEKNQGHANNANEGHRAILEVMVAEMPSEANPFHSRRNRLRRADFLLRTGQAQPQKPSFGAWQSHEELALVLDRWSEMSFSGKQKARVNWSSARRSTTS